MELSQFYQLIKSGKTTLLFSVLIFVLFAMGYTFLRPLEFSAQSRLLIIQNSQEGMDPFVSAKANEYLGGVLTKIVTSNSFLEEVLAAGLNVDSTYFSNDQQVRAKTWQEMVSARSYGDLGVIEITVFHPDKYQAKQVAEAIDLTLKNKSNIFLSTGDKVLLRVIDQPIVSKWPVRPNIVLNMILGPVMGLVFGLFYLYLFAKISTQPIVESHVVQTNNKEFLIQPADISTVTSESIAPIVAVSVVPAEASENKEVTPSLKPVDVVKPEIRPATRPSVNNDFDLDDILNQGNINNLL